MIPLEKLKTVTQLWSIDFKTLRHDLHLHGSPERSRFRAAFEDTTGGLFVLEQIAAAHRKRKISIHSILNQLHAEGLNQVNPYLRTSSGECLVFCGGDWWQISKFIKGTPLNRPEYVRNASKGAALARFLCDFSIHAKALPHDGTMPSFSLSRYILRLENDMMAHDPDVYSRFLPMIDVLRRSFIKAYDTLPVVFCHGDYHPLNIIWQDDNIVSVIDWEFCGPKPDIYDAANLVGCVGMEDPSGLMDDLVISFIDYMHRFSCISAQSWNLFPIFVIALRFAWLAEWLRNRDKEMVDLEETYMNLLYDNMEELTAIWVMRG